MNSGDNFYSSVSDRWWFSGNPHLEEKKRFTWFIDKSGSASSNWKISFSEAGPVYMKPPSLNILNSVEKKALPPLLLG